MKRIVLAAIIVVSLITLSSLFALEQHYPPESPGHVMHCQLSKLPLSPSWPATSNEPASKAVTPTLTPSFTGHIPVTINLGNVSDLSFIYESGKLAYVQFFSKDYDRVIRITAEDYWRLVRMGKGTYYGTFAPRDHDQAVHETGHRNGLQEKANGLSEYVTSAREMVNSLRGYTQGMIDMVRTVAVPAVNATVVTPLRDYTQGMINKVRTAMA